jgi:glutamyl/glutaminyl-tRNA synthetase
MLTWQQLRRFTDFAPKSQPLQYVLGVDAPRLYAVATKNSLNLSEAKMRVICRRAGCSSSNSDIERAGMEAFNPHVVKRDMHAVIAQTLQKIPTYHPGF